MTEKCKNILKDDHGVTMAETLVAFALLIIISLSFLAILSFSSRMTMEADDRRALAQELDEKLAHKGDEGFLSQEMTVSLRSKDGTESIALENCVVYSLDWPDITDPEVTVLRFHFKGE